MPTSDRPLIFLDVDGTLIPFASRPVGLGSMKCGEVPDQPEIDANPLLARLNPDDGRRLLALGCQLVWATTWMTEANEVASPRIGLPELPVVEWPDSDDEPRDGVHWKTEFLTEYAAGRTFVWLDDEITDADRRWVSAHHSGKALLHRIGPRVGLTDADFSLIRRWLTEQ